jgi:predicted Rossmann-fold nucleotide-binding protein
MNETEISKIAVFGGASGGAPDSGIKAFRQKWEAVDRDWSQLNPTDIENLDAMWLAADLGRVLSRNNWQVMTGGYNVGTMGMIDRSVAVFGRRDRQTRQTTGVPLTSYFSNIPHTKGEIRGASNLGNRLGEIMSADAFIVLRGTTGTLTELFVMIEEENLRRLSKLGFEPRPIIVADPTGKMIDPLHYLFAEFSSQAINDPNPNVTDNIHILGQDDFRQSRENPNSATTRLSVLGERRLLAILGNEVNDLPSQTLRENLKASYERQ